MKNIKAVLANTSIMPILTVDSVEQALKTSEALLKGGINAVEVTLRTAAGLDAIKAIKQELPNMIVGAGTVVNAKDAEAVKLAGVDFAVSPATTERLYDAIAAVDLPFLPGVATPSEVLSGMERGFEHFKLFPAVAVGGKALLKSIAPPLAAAKFCPTGGLNPNNFIEFLALSNVFCIGGSWMVSQPLLDAEDWQGITDLSKQATDAVALAKSAGDWPGAEI